MTIEQAKIGTKVRSNVEFSGVPIGTEGIITSDYGTGVMVEWKIPTDSKPLTDGFDKEDELQYLDLASNEPTQ